MTAAVQGVSADYARQLTDRIKVAAEGTWQLLMEAYTVGAHLALGYGSWDDYCTREFGALRLKLPREDRVETVQSLRSAGLSIRAIASATGHSVNTIQADMAQVYQSDTPLPARSYSAEPASADHDGLAAAVAAELAAGDEAHAEQAKAVQGIDGKTYPAQQKRAPYRKPLPDVARNAGFELRKSMERIERLFDDDRYRSNAEQVATALRGHLLYVAETVTAVLDQLP